MTKKLDWLIRKPTFFSVISTVVIIFASPYLFYLGFIENGAELALAVIFLLILIAMSVIAFDRVFVKFFSNKAVSIVEISICVIVYITYALLK